MTNRSAPAPVSLPAGTATAIAQGEGHGCAIVDGAAYCWGNAAIGNGQPTSALPQAVSLPATLTSITVGGGFACAVASPNVYCWGNDTNGALGNGNGGSSLMPVLVSLPAAAISIDAGNDHAIALLADGRVFVWGHNDNGIFGTGSLSPTTSDVPIPTSITGALPAIGGWHGCVLIAGRVSCWGEGVNGELGDGLSQDNTNPVVAIASGVIALDAGGGPTNHDATCASVAGSVRCWGMGTAGRLGTGNTANAATPKPVLGLPADIVELALGFEHTCARTSSGNVHCWGRGDLGQLGDGRSVNDLSPVVVATP